MWRYKAGLLWNIYDISSKYQTTGPDIYFVKYGLFSVLRIVCTKTEIVVKILLFKGTQAWDNFNFFYLNQILICPS